MVVIFMIALRFIDFDCYDRFIGSAVYPASLPQVDDFFDIRILVFRRFFFPECAILK
jgi:hypothetical protein